MIPRADNCIAAAAIAPPTVTEYSAGETADVSEKLALSPETVGKKISRHARFPMFVPKVAQPTSTAAGCAAFVQEALDRAAVPLPLKGSYDVRDLRRALFNSSQWKLVYKHGTEFQSFKAQAGDIAIWDKSTRAQDELSGRQTLIQQLACGVLDGRGRIIHPSNRPRTASLTEMSAICATPLFGEPTAIYRRVEMLR